jgi:hypothetical protein
MIDVEIGKTLAHEAHVGGEIAHADVVGVGVHVLVKRVLAPCGMHPRLGRLAVRAAASVVARTRPAYPR